MRNILTHIDNVLKGCYSAAELYSIKRALCLELLGISDFTYYTKETLIPDSNRERKLEAALSRLAKGEPLQYVLGSTPFCGLTFRVDRRVLIPRPETAELVEWVERDAGASGSLLDIGTGSGCIAVTLAHNLPRWKVQGWDISEGALEVACENSRLNGAEVEFLNVDILEAPELEHCFDVIVSNPPYVLESEKAQMSDTVLDHEPHTALFVPDTEPLMFYSAIAEFGKKALVTGGKLYFEINPIEASALEEMLVQAEYHNVELRKDIFGKQRMIKALL